MSKKPNKSRYSPYFESENTSFATLLDAIDPDPERLAQRQEYLKQMKKEAYKALGKKRQKSQKIIHKPKSMSFDEKLERTWQWLQETFPDLFDPSQPYKALDVNIVRDIKAYYKKYHVKNKYPDNLVIKAALYRYIESSDYLACLIEGAPRYNIKGEISGVV